MTNGDNHERFSNLWDGLYKIVLLVGVLFAAGFDFFIARKPEIAESELRAVRQILADVELSPTTWSINNKCYLLITATVQNKGVREARLRLDSIPWKLALVSFDSVPPHYKPIVKFSPRTFTRGGKNVVALPVTELVPNEVATYEMVTEVRPGRIVFAEFSIPVSEQLNRVPLSTADSVKPWRWSARGHFATCGVAGAAGSADANVARKSN